MQVELWIFQETSIVGSKQQSWFNKALKQTLNFEHALSPGFSEVLTYVLLYKEGLKYVLTVKLVLKCLVELGPTIQPSLCLPDTNCAWHPGNSNRGCSSHLPAELFPSHWGCIYFAAQLMCSGWQGQVTPSTSVPLSLPIPWDPHGTTCREIKTHFICKSLWRPNLEICCLFHCFFKTSKFSHNVLYVHWRCLLSLALFWSGWGFCKSWVARIALCNDLASIVNLYEWEINFCNFLPS